MKEFYYYIKWVWNRWDKDEVVFFSAIFLIGTSWIPSYWFNSKFISGLMVLLAAILFVSMAIKILIIDTICRSFKEYKKEKARTIDKLKRDY